MQCVQCSAVYVLQYVIRVIYLLAFTAFILWAAYRTWAPMLGVVQCGAVECCTRALKLRAMRHVIYPRG